MLSPALFANLSAESPRERWRQTLQDVGLLSLQADESQEGQLIKAIQKECLTPPKKPLPWLEILLILVPLLVIVPLWVLALRDLGGGSVICFGFFGFTPSVIGWLRGRFRAIGPPDSAVLHGLVQTLLQRNFLQGMGNVLVENVPTRAFLQERLQLLGQTLSALEQRDAELQTLLLRIQDLNRRMSQPADDAETAAIQRSRQDLVALRAQLRALQGEFSGKLVELDQRLAERRLRVERMVLSSQVDRLREQRVQMPALDLDGFSGEIQALDLQIQEAQLRIAANLEVADPGQPPNSL